MLPHCPCRFKRSKGVLHVLISVRVHSKYPSRWNCQIKVMGNIEISMTRSACQLNLGLQTCLSPFAVVLVLYCCLISYPQNTLTWNNTRLLSQSFCGPRIQAWLHRVHSLQVSHELPPRCGLYCGHLMAQVGKKKICLQAQLMWLLLGFGSSQTVELRVSVPHRCWLEATLCSLSCWPLYQHVQAEKTIKRIC